MKNLLGMLFLGFVLLGCIAQPSQPQPPVNETKSVELGDVIYVDYTLKLENGTVADTSLKEVAKEAGIYDASRTYSPLKFKISYDAGIINGFINGVIGMKPGETKLIVVKPEDGYGLRDSKKVYSVPLYYNMSKIEKVPRELLESQKIKIEKDKIINTNNGFMLVINDFDNDTVSVEYLLRVGDKFSSYGAPQEVINATNDTLNIKLGFELGKEYVVWDDAGNKKAIRVTGLNQTEATIDENHPLAGQTLYFNVTLREIVGQ